MADGDLVQLPWPDDAPHPLGRSIRHDPASRNFPAPRRAVPTKDKRHRVYGAKLDQDGIGACTGFTAAHCLNAEPARAFVRPEPTLTNAHAFDFYRGGSRLDPWPGAWEPEDTGSSGLAVCQHLRNIGRIPRYEWAFGFQHGLEVISYATLMQGTWWPEGMFHPDADGRVRPTGPDAGGHEYLWVGIEIRSKLTPSQNRSWFLNSWGRWGKYGSGFFYLTWDDHEALLARQGDLIRPAPEAI